MRKRVISWLLTVVMVVSMLPTSVLADTLAADQEQQTQQEQTTVPEDGGESAAPEDTAASKTESVPQETTVQAADTQAAAVSVQATVTLDSYFAGLPVTAETEPGSPNSTNKWTVATLEGESVLKSGNAGKSSSSSTLQLTFTSDVHMTFEYKVSSEARYDKCTITLGSTTLVNGESGDLGWKTQEVDAKSGDVLQVVYKKDSGGDRNHDCVYLRNFSAGTPLLVTLHANNGTDDTVQQKIYGGKGTLPANTFTCDGKVFAGWAASAGGEVLYQDGAAITLEADLDLYAVWADAYTVTFDNDGSTTEVLVPQSSAIGSRLPAAPAKRGYTFGGWFSGDTQLTAETVITGDMTCTAKWTAITYTIAFSANEGTGTMESISAAYDEEVTLPKNAFTRPGYSFSGWRTYSGTYQDEQTVRNLASEQGKTVTLYAAWSGLPVNVTLKLNYEGTEDITRTGIVGSNYNYIVTESGGSKFSQVADPVRTGYIFDGWFDAAEGGSKISTTYKFTAEDAHNGFTMYAHWTKGITVHFDGNGYKNTIADKTVTPDKVYSSLPYTSSTYFPANKALEGWYVKNADGSFGKAVTEDTVFSGDEVTLIAKWRDYQYIIKFNIKYSDKSTTTGTMADQVVPFGQDAALTKCAFSREGYEFAGWGTSSYGSTVAYADGSTINRAWDDDYWDGSSDNETFNLYAIWTEKKSPEQTAAEEKLSAADTAITGNYTPAYGTDENALTMIRAKLAAAGITDVTVTMKEAVSNSWTYVGIAADGTIQYKWNPNGTTSASEGNVRPTVVLSCQGTDGKTYTRESTGCYFIIGLDEAKAKAALRAVADRITVPETVESPDDLTSLPKYPLKAGVDAGSVDYNKSDDLELWTTAAWSSGDTAVISVSDVSYPYFSPYKATVSLPAQDTSVTLTLTLTYNGREDLKDGKVYTVNVKGSDAPVDNKYQTALDKALTDIGLTNPKDGSKIDVNNVTSDIQFPTTRDLSRLMEDGFDGKYTPILLCTSNADVVVSADPDTANVARMLTYRPLPGQDAATVTVTVKILNRPSGEGKDYASMEVLASKDITLIVQSLTKTELDTAAAFMKKVTTADVYWEGIRKANSDKNNVTGDLYRFIEIVPDGDGYTFIRNVDDWNQCGVKADDIPGWYDAQQYRCFRSSRPDVVTHENLLVLQPEYNTEVTIDSVFSYTEYAKYWEKFRDNGAYAQFEQFYQQPVSLTVKVAGTTGKDDPNAQKDLTATVKVTGYESFPTVTDYTFTGKAGQAWSAWDAVKACLDANGYTCDGSGSYLKSLTKGGVTLGAGDHGTESGWMFRVTRDGKTVTPNTTLGTYFLKSGDVVELFYTTVSIPLDPAETDPSITNRDFGQAYSQTKIFSGVNALAPDVGRSATDNTSAWGDWIVLAMARSGMKLSDQFIKDYYAKVEAYVKANYNANGTLKYDGRNDRYFLTDNARLTLALTAIGKDPANVGGKNLLTALKDSSVAPKQTSDKIFALIALDSKNYGSAAESRRWVDLILDAQESDGGWKTSTSATASDIDMTAMAVTALAPYYGEGNSKLDAAVDKAISWLSAQYQSGNYTSSETCAQVVVALSALGIDANADARFVRTVAAGDSEVSTQSLKQNTRTASVSVLSALLQYHVQDQGFKHVSDGPVTALSTEQGLYAMAAYQRYATQSKRLYDMTDVQTGQDKPSGGSGNYYYPGTAVGTKTDSANTADDSQMVLWLGSAVLAAAAVVVLTRKKRVSK